MTNLKMVTDRGSASAGLGMVKVLGNERLKKFLECLVELFKVEKSHNELCDVCSSNS